MATNRATPGATMIKIDKSYAVGSDEHCHFCFLAKPLVGGSARSSLSDTKLSRIKQTVFDKQHSEESVPLVRMLLSECGDKKSSDMLKEFDTNSLPFTGETVKEEQRISYNFNHLLVDVVTNLDNDERSDMITLLRELKVDIEEKKTNFQTLLFLLERATQSGIILPLQLDQLKKLLEDCSRQDLIRSVNQFDPKKQFPGLETPVLETDVEFQRQCSEPKRGASTTVPKVPRQESDDSAYGEGDPRERSGSHGDPQSKASYRNSEKTSRFQEESIEETVKGITELVVQRQNNISPNQQ